MFLRSGHNVPVSIKTNVSLCSDDKVSVLGRKVPRFNFCPLGPLCQPVTLPRSICPASSLGPSACAQILLKRQLSAGGALGARSPDAVIIAEGARHPGPNCPLVPSGHQSARAGPADCVPGRWPLPLDHRWGQGRGSPPPQGLGPPSGQFW